MEASASAAAEKRGEMGKLLGQIGTIEWCRATGGMLGSSERRRFVAAVMLETARSMPRLLLYGAGIKGSGPDPSSFSPPDTSLTRRVLEASAHLDPMLLQHSYRSYLFARALGARDHLPCDDEALFVAAMLHDYAFPLLETGDRCFTLKGAEVAAELLREASLSAELLHDVLDAITLHLNPRVTREQGNLQHLLHAGVMVDTVGVRAWQLDAAGMRDVLACHPRHGYVMRGDPRLRAHAVRHPRSRARQLYRCGFGMALRLGPWHAQEARTQRLAAQRAPRLAAGTERP